MLLIRVQVDQSAGKNEKYKKLDCCSTRSSAALWCALCSFSYMAYLRKELR
jgi:hypothetical protein